MSQGPTVQYQYYAPLDIWFSAIHNPGPVLQNAPPEANWAEYAAPAASIYPRNPVADNPLGHVPAITARNAQKTSKLRKEC